jgi:hypothetical protein
MLGMAWQFTSVLPTPVRKIKFNNPCKAFVWEDTKDPAKPKQRRYVGLLNVLQHAYYPNYTYERATQGSDGGETKAPKAWWERGLEFGTKVDKQIKHVVQFINKKRITVAKFLEEIAPRVVKAKLKPKAKAKAKGKAKPKAKARATRPFYNEKLHRFTAMFLRYLVGAGLHPIGAQVPVACHAGQTCTAIDVLCLGNKGTELVDVEVKVNYDACYMKHTGRQLATPFGIMNDSPLNQHQLALLAQYMMLKETYAGLKLPVRAMVVRLTSPGVTLYELQTTAFFSPGPNGSDSRAICLWKQLCGPATMKACGGNPRNCSCSICNMRKLLGGG